MILITNKKTSKIITGPCLVQLFSFFYVARTITILFSHLRFKVLQHIFFLT